VPHCAHPSYTQGYYDRDNVFYLNWDKISEDRANVNTWLEERVYGLKMPVNTGKTGGGNPFPPGSKTRYAAPVNYGDY
jgi:glutaconate CoA-transferase subunit A